MIPLVYQPLGPLPVDGSTHLAILDEIEGLDKPLTLEHGDCLRFHFSFTQKPFSKRGATLLTSTALNEHARLHGFATSMLGRDIDEGEDIAPALRASIGETFRIVVRHRPFGNGDAVFLDVAEIEPFTNGGAESE